MKANRFKKGLYSISGFRRAHYGYRPVCGRIHGFVRLAINAR